MRTRVVVPCMLLFACLFTTSYSQPAGSNAKGNIPPQVLEHLKKNKKNLELEDSDIADLAVSDQYTSKHSGVQHVYVIQRHKGIEIHGAVTNVNLSKEGKVLSMGNRFHKSVEKKIKGNDVKLSAADAVAAAAMHLKTPLKEALLSLIHI